MNDYTYKPFLQPLKAGDTLKDGHYKIIELTSNRGGFGRIYKAYSYASKRVSAIKEFHIREMEELEQEWSRMYSYTRNLTEHDIDTLRKKFYREVEQLVYLYKQHDRHLPYIHNTVWQEPDGRLFYSMTFIDGQTLREKMDSQEGPMPEEKAINYIIQVGKVLHKAHALGMVHADVSPNNIMLKKGSDWAVLVDWGNARSYDDELLLDSMDPQSRKQHKPFQDDLHDIPIGTLGYLAPQEFWGTPQMDVYSLAATLFYLLTGRLPKLLSNTKQEASARNLLQKRHVSEQTIDAIMHAMNVNREQATGSIFELLSELPQEIVLKILLNYTDHDNNQR